VSDEAAVAVAVEASQALASNESIEQGFAGDGEVGQIPANPLAIVRLGGTDAAGVSIFE
jgi:hypothetical protein